MIEIELIELSKIELLRLIHLFICALAALFLILLWKRVIIIDKKNKNDIGLLLIAGAFLMWVFMDTYRFTGLMKPGESSLIIKTFSAYNNAFFIASLPFFSNSFKWMHRRIKLFHAKTKWSLLVLISNILIVMVYSMVWKNEKDSGIIVNYIDLIYSIITYTLLGIAICSWIYAKVSMSRIIFIIAILLSVSLVLVQLAFSPLFQITHYDLLTSTAMICHTLLVMLLISIGYEWLLEQQTSLVSEQNRTAIQIKTYELKNEQLNKELMLLRSKIKDERSLSILTERELEILKHINKSYSEIGIKLFISRDTVITHKKNIEAKLDLKSKIELEKFAKSKGILSS